MKALLFIGMVLGLSCSLIAAENHVVDLRSAKNESEGRKNAAGFNTNGDLHVFDFKIDYTGKLTTADIKKIMKTTLPHEGLWFVPAKQDDLPEGIAFRVYHLAEKSSRYKGGERPTLQPEKSTMEKAVSDGNAAFDAGNFEVALDFYVKAFNEDGNARVAPYAMYMAGQCLCALHKYKESISLHKALVQRYPNSQYVPDAMFRIAYVLGGHLEKAQDAIALLTALGEKFPVNVPECAFAISVLNLLQGKTEQAQAGFAKIRQHYANSAYGNYAKAFLKN